MTKISNSGIEYIATASLDSMLMIWDTDAQKIFECQEQDIISTMAVCNDISGNN